MGQRITCIDTADQKKKKSHAPFTHLKEKKKCKASLSALNRGLTDSELRSFRGLGLSFQRSLSGSWKEVFQPTDSQPLVYTVGRTTHTHTHTHVWFAKRWVRKEQRKSHAKSLVSCRKAHFVEDISERWQGTSGGGQATAPQKEQSIAVPPFGFVLLFNSVGGKIKPSSYSLNFCYSRMFNHWMVELRGKRSRLPCNPWHGNACCVLFLLEDSLGIQFGSMMLSSA